MEVSSLATTLKSVEVRSILATCFEHLSSAYLVSDKWIMHEYAKMTT